MKKKILSRFSITEEYGKRKLFVFIYVLSGVYYVAWKSTSITNVMTLSFGTDFIRARFAYYQKVLFLLCNNFRFV